MSDTRLYPEPPRPRMCPEPSCRPLTQWPGYTKEQLDEGVREWESGESWICWGVLSQPVVYIYDGVNHPNDCRTCTFTPAKGLISFQENRDDWWVLTRRYQDALDQLDAFREVSQTIGAKSEQDNPSRTPESTEGDTDA